MAPYREYHPRFTDEEAKVRSGEELAQSHTARHRRPSTAPTWARSGALVSNYYTPLPVHMYGGAC